MRLPISDWKKFRKSFSTREGKSVAVFGLFSFAEIKWAKKLQSSLGYSMEMIENSDCSHPMILGKVSYALINLRYYP